MKTFETNEPEMAANNLKIWLAFEKQISSEVVKTPARVLGGYNVVLDTGEVVKFRRPRA